MTIGLLRYAWPLASSPPSTASHSTQRIACNELAHSCHNGVRHSTLRCTFRHLCYDATWEAIRCQVESCRHLAPDRSHASAGMGNDGPRRMGRFDTFLADQRPATVIPPGVGCFGRAVFASGTPAGEADAKKKKKKKQQGARPRIAVRGRLVPTSSASAAPVNGSPLITLPVSSPKRAAAAVRRQRVNARAAISAARLAGSVSRAAAATKACATARLPAPDFRTPLAALKVGLAILEATLVAVQAPAPESARPSCVLDDDGPESTSVPNRRPSRTIYRAIRRQLTSN